MTQSEHRKMYSRRWVKERLLFLYANPLCIMCEQQGILNGATVVDHIKPHRGDIDLFWDNNNWQALCKTHHDSAKQAQEKSGIIKGGNINGEPTDPAHHWHREGRVKSRKGL